METETTRTAAAGALSARRACEHTLSPFANKHASRYRQGPMKKPQGNPSIPRLQDDDPYCASYGHARPHTHTQSRSSGAGGAAWQKCRARAVPRRAWEHTLPSFASKHASCYGQKPIKFIVGPTISGLQDAHPYCASHGTQYHATIVAQALAARPGQREP